MSVASEFIGDAKARLPILRTPDSFRHAAAVLMMTGSDLALTYGFG